MEEEAGSRGVGVEFESRGEIWRGKSCASFARRGKAETASIVMRCAGYAASHPRLAFWQTGLTKGQSVVSAFEREGQGTQRGCAATEGNSRKEDEVFGHKKHEVSPCSRKFAW